MFVHALDMPRVRVRVGVYNDGRGRAGLGHIHVYLSRRCPRERDVCVCVKNWAPGVETAQRGNIEYKNMPQRQAGYQRRAREGRTDR